MANEVKFNIRLTVDGKERLVEATADVRKFAQEFENARTEATKTRDSLLTFNQTIQVMETACNALSQFSAVLHNLTDESNAFAAAMRAANTMAGKDAAGFEKLKGEVAALSKEIPIARDELANGLYQVISNGVPEDNWISFLEQSSKSSVGGIANLGEVVKVTSGIIKNYALEWDSAENIQDMIQLTAKNGVTSFEQLAAAIPRVSGNAAQLGVTMEEMFAVFSTTTGAVGNTAEISTMLAAVFTSLIKPSSEATKAAEAMGIQFDAASIRMKGGLQNFLKDLDQSIEQYAKKTGQLKETIYGQLFGSAEALRLLTPLTGNLSEKFQQNVAEMANSAGTIEDAYGNMSGTVSAALQKLQNKWGSFTDSIAGGVAFIQPVLDFGTQLGMTVVSVIAMKRALQELGVTQGLVALRSKAVGLAMLLMGQNASRSAVVVRIFNGALRSTAYAATAAKLALRGLLTSTVIGAAIAALGYGLEKLIEYLDGTGDAAEEAAEKTDMVAEAQKRVSDVYKSTESETYGSLMTTYRKLQAEWQNLSTAHSRNKWLKENASEFERLGLKVTSAKDAENVFRGNTQAVVDSFVARAKAAARLAQLTEEYRLQMELIDKITTSDNAAQQRHHVNAGDKADISSWNRDRDGKYIELASDGSYRYTEAGALRANKVRWIGNTAEDKANRKALKESQDRSKRLESGMAEDIKTTKTKVTISPKIDPDEKKTKHTPNTTSTKDEELSEVAAPRRYKDYANNVSYYQQELEKANVTDKAAIETLTKKKLAAEAVVEAFKETVETMGVPGSPKSLDDYDKKLQHLQKIRGKASKEAIAGIDEEIRKTEEARDNLENSTVAAMRDDELQTLGDINKKLEYYNSLLNRGNALQRQQAQRSINSLSRRKEQIEDSLKELSLPSTTDNMRDIDDTISFYTQRQQQEDADQIQRTQVLIDQLTAKRKVLQLGVELPSAMREISEIESLTGRERRIRIKAVGFDELTSRIKELRKQLADTENPVTDSQRKDIEGIIATYERWRRKSVSAFSTARDGWDGLRGIGDTIHGITEALEGNGDAWQQVTSIVDGCIQIYESVEKITGIIRLLTELVWGHTAAKTAEGVATGVTATATDAASAGEAAAAKAVLPAIAANKSATASFLELASAMFFAAHASIPIGGFAIGAGYSTAATAMVKTIGAMAFAKGAIVSGPTYALVGEYAGASNNPEVVAPLDKLRGMLRPQEARGGVIRLEVHGRKLVGVLSNETKIASKSGRRTNIII